MYKTTIRSEVLEKDYMPEKHLLSIRSRYCEKEKRLYKTRVVGTVQVLKCNLSHILTVGDKLELTNIYPQDTFGGLECNGKTTSKIIEITYDTEDNIVYTVESVFEPIETKRTQESLEEAIQMDNMIQLSEEAKKSIENRQSADTSKPSFMDSLKRLFKGEV